MVNAFALCWSDRASIHDRVKDLAKYLFCSSRMRPWESLHVEGPTALAGPHPLNIKCCIRCYSGNIQTLSSSASGVVLCTVHVSKVSQGHLT